MLVNLYQRHNISLQSTFQITPSPCYAALASVGGSVEFNSPWDITKTRFRPAKCMSFEMQC